MRWLDVCGAPGAGKSVTCYAIWSDDQGKEFAARGLRPLPYWKPYLEEVNSLYELVKDHISRDPCDKHCGQPSIRKVVGMNNRSIAKIAAVERERVTNICRRNTSGGMVKQRSSSKPASSSASSASAGASMKCAGTST